MYGILSKLTLFHKAELPVRKIWLNILARGHKILFLIAASLDHRHHKKWHNDGVYQDTEVSFGLFLCCTNFKNRS